jgi:hypothetical protein
MYPPNDPQVSASSVMRMRSNYKDSVWHIFYLRAQPAVYSDSVSSKRVWFFEIVCMGKINVWSFGWTCLRQCRYTFFTGKNLSLCVTAFNLIKTTTFDCQYLRSDLEHMYLHSNPLIQSRFCCQSNQSNRLLIVELTNQIQPCYLLLYWATPYLLITVHTYREMQ